MENASTEAQQTEAARRSRELLPGFCLAIQAEAPTADGC